MDVKLAIVLAGTALLGWWLSGYDSNLSGENRAADLTRRIVRCAATLLLVGLAVGAGLGEAKLGGFVFIVLVIPLAILWTGCLSEVFARAFHGLIDPPGTSYFDPKMLAPALDRVASLFEQGRHEEAIKLCTALVEAGHASSQAMETMLFRLYDQVFAEARLLLSPALAEAQRFCQEGRAAEAESRLTSLLKQEPANLGAVMMLTHIYAMDSRHPDKAYALLRDREHDRGLPPFFIAYARHRVGEWLFPATSEKGNEGIESLLVDKDRLKPGSLRQ